MATRTIKFKLVVPRSEAPDAVRARRALWATHLFVNEAVAHYERLLLEMRQADVLVRGPDGVEVVEAGDVWSGRLRERLLRLGREPKRAQEALPKLRALYEQIVRSSVEPGSGSAQDGRSYHSALVDAASAAFESRRRKLETLEPLRQHLEGPAADFERAAKRLITAHQDELLRATGAPARWVKLYKADDPSWVEALASYLRKSDQSAEGDPLAWLQENGVLPLLEPHARGRLAESERLTTYERMALALAVSHLNSWESWADRTRRQYEEREERRLGWARAHGESCRKTLEAIRGFESRREGELEEVSFWTPQSVYRLRPRELRGWRELRDWLRSHPGASQEARVEFVHDLQRQMGRAFGSEVALRWLGLPGQQWMADLADDTVSRVAAYNRLLDLVDRTRRLPLYTPPDARCHPQWAGFDPPNNSNQPPFVLESDKGGRTVASIQLLAPGDDELLVQETFSFRLAPSRQFFLGKIRISDGSRRRAERPLLLEAEAQDRLSRISGQIGGSNLLFDRARLEGTDAKRLAAGALGDVFLKVAVDISEPGAEDRLRARRKQATWLKSSLDKRRTSTTQVGDGFSVLSVDLGLRAAASIAVFRVSKEAPSASHWPMAEVGGCPVVHERSAMLRLPGEHSGKKETRRRQAEAAEVAGLRASLAALWRVRRLFHATDRDERQRRLEELVASDTVRLGSDEVRALAAGLGSQVAAPQEAWAEACERVFMALERAIGQEISVWRRRTRQRMHEPLGGKSVWRIEYLERTRRLLMAWHRHQRPRHEDVQRLDRERFGTVAAKLLAHINALKDDRVKTTADLIVQAARGLAYFNGAWVHRHKPVDVIVLEDLGRYLSRSDRPPAENRQLMRWAHREINRTVELQAECYGIAVLDTSARFSSRFDALSRAPGVRCEHATHDLMGFMRSAQGQALAARLRRAGIDPAAVLEGDLLPLGRGELLVSVDGSDGLRTRNADINAAQNLAVWSLEGYAQPFRLTATRISDDPPVFGAAKLGKRQQSVFGGGAVVLRETTQGAGTFTLEAHRSWSHAARAVGIETGGEAPQGGEDDVALQDIADVVVAEFDLAQAELSGGRVTLFRDPSATILGGHWAESKVFWGVVQSEIVRRLRSGGQLHG